MGAQPCSDLQVRTLRALSRQGPWLELSTANETCLESLRHAACASTCHQHRLRRDSSAQQSRGRPYLLTRALCRVAGRRPPAGSSAARSPCSAGGSLTAPGDVEPSVAEFALCIFVIGPARSTAVGDAKTCCCNVGPVHVGARARGDISALCRRSVSRRLHSRRMSAASPLLLDFFARRSMMAFASRQHAREMNCGPHAPWPFSYWAARRRSRSARKLGQNLRLPLIHLSIPIPLHTRCRTYQCAGERQQAPSRVKEEFSLCGSGRKSSSDARFFLAASPRVVASGASCPKRN
jgi:hypothetical protein